MASWVLNETQIGQLARIELRYILAELAMKSILLVVVGLLAPGAPAWQTPYRQPAIHPLGQVQTRTSNVSKGDMTMGPRKMAATVTTTLKEL